MHPSTLLITLLSTLLTLTTSHPLTSPASLTPRQLKPLPTCACAVSAAAACAKDPGHPPGVDSCFCKNRAVFSCQSSCTAVPAVQNCRLTQPSSLPASAAAAAAAPPSPPRLQAHTALCGGSLAGCEAGYSCSKVAADLGSYFDEPTVVGMSVNGTMGVCISDMKAKTPPKVRRGVFWGH